MTGKVAAIGGRMLAGATRALIRSFFARLVRAGRSDEARPWWRRIVRIPQFRRMG